MNTDREYVATAAARAVSWRDLWSALRLAALGVCILAFAACGKRKPSASAGRDSVGPGGSAMSAESLHPAAPAPAPAALGTSGAAGPQPRDPEAVQAEIGGIQTRLGELGKEMGANYRRIAELQREQRAGNPAIAALGEEVETLRGRLQERFDAVPGMAAKTSRKNELQQERQALLAAQAGTPQKAMSAQEKRDFLSGRAAHYARLRSLNADLGGIGREVAGLKDRARAEDPEIRSLSASLSEQQTRLAAMIASTPEMRSLRQRQEDLQTEATALVERDRELKGDAPYVENEEDAGGGAD